MQSELRQTDPFDFCHLSPSSDVFPLNFDYFWGQCDDFLDSGVSLLKSLYTSPRNSHKLADFMVLAGNWSLWESF